MLQWLRINKDYGKELANGRKGRICFLARFLNLTKPLIGMNLFQEGNISAKF